MKNNIFTRKFAIRLFSVILFVFAIFFGATYRKTGYCFGDVVFSSVGFNTWSNGNEGTHYAGVLGLAFSLIALYMFAMTTNKKQKTLRYLIYGITVGVAVLNLLSAFI